MLSCGEVGRCSASVPNGKQMDAEPLWPLACCSLHMARIITHRHAARVAKKLVSVQTDETSWLIELTADGQTDRLSRFIQLQAVWRLDTDLCSSGIALPHRSRNHRTATGRENLTATCRCKRVNHLFELREYVG